MYMVLGFHQLRLSSLDCVPMERAAKRSFPPPPRLQAKPWKGMKPEALDAKKHGDSSGGSDFGKPRGIFFGFAC